MSARPRNDESGAVALYVALLVTLLISMAALTVDLGNAWARGRAVQKQADVSAISAGHLLPMTSSNVLAIAAESAKYLNANPVPGQPEATASELVDGAMANGEVQFFDRGGAPCAEKCPRMTLTPPEAEVGFAFAGAMGLAETQVRRSATVLVVSELPPKDKTIPLWLPSGCGYGPVDGDTTGGNSNHAVPAAAETPTPTPEAETSGPSPSGSPSPTPSPPPPAVVPDPRGTHSLSGLSPIVVTQNGSVSVTSYRIDNLGANIDKATIRLVAPDGSRYVDYAASSNVPKSFMEVAAFDVGPEVTSTLGDWLAYAIIQANGANKPEEYSANNLIVRVIGPSSPSTPTDDPTASSSTSPSTSPTNVPVGCVGQERGNFGQLYSPRLDTTDKNVALPRNFAFGLDHTLLPFDTARYGEEKECASKNGSGKIEGAQLDDVSRDGNNCIVGDTGNDGPKMYMGLISGVDGRPGRLDVSNGATTCARPDLEIGETTVNNDVLSCFLRNGATLDDIAQQSGVDQSMLDPSVLRSPRLVYLPIVLATDRAQKGYQPIIDFVPAFITDETQNSAATSTNGLDINGNSIKVIRLFAFNQDALPIDERSPDSDYMETLDRAIVRLIG